MLTGTIWYVTFCKSVCTAYGSSVCLIKYRAVLLKKPSNQ